MFCRKCQIWIQKLYFSTLFSQAITVKSSPSCRAQNSLSNGVSLRKFYWKMCAHKIKRATCWIIWKK